MTFVRRNPMVSFFVLAYGLSWAYWIPLALAGGRTAPGSTATHVPGLLGPGLAAFFITAVTEGRAGVISFAKRLVLISRPTSRFLAAALWHALYNMTSATAASRGVIAVVTTTCVMVWATVLLIEEARRRTHPPTLLVERAG